VVGRVKSALVQILVSVAAGLALAAHAGSFEIYAPRHRSAEELAPLVATVMGEGGSAVADAHSGKIVLSGDPAALAQARAALASLDQPVRQYRIDSETATRASLEAAGARVSGWLDAGDLRIGRVRGPEGVRIRAGAGGTESRERLAASIVVQEGRSAEIWTGASVPVTSRTVERLGPYARATETTQLVDVRSGFRVRPRSAGPDAVELEITPVVAEIERGGSIRETGAATQVRVRLGESVALGSLETESERSGVDVPSGAASASASAATLLLVRVTPLETAPAARAPGDR
jgi:type II secretory pathway component GspD/PulD (secretin)